VRKVCGNKCRIKMLSSRDQTGKNNSSWIDKDIFTEQQIREEYINKTHGMTHIAKKYNVHRSTILYNLNKFNIKRRTFEEQMAASSKNGDIDYRGLIGKENPAHTHGKAVGNKKNREIYLNIAKNNNKWVCDTCGVNNTNSNFDLIVHHIDGNNRNNNVDNLMVLCQSCHTKIHVNDKKNVKKCKECGIKFKAKNTQKYCTSECLRQHSLKEKKVKL